MEIRPGHSPAAAISGYHPNRWYLGKTTFGMRVPLSEVVVISCLITLSRTVVFKKVSCIFFLKPQAISSQAFYTPGASALRKCFNLIEF
jgi:hypothetical protein